jgi:tRNA nucleotidyltransferase (CCA-adding enzyme)
MMAGMEIYEVGGAVRDAMLGITAHERDWVVVGGTTEEMQRLGYRSVGKDFPVFLHPQTGEQYALARTERKTAPGYHGFAFDTSSTVTLEQDLARRDLTINAMARDAQGNVIDPWGGMQDLERRLLRHVSPAFREDPVRILRVARFAARYSHLGFRVAEDTLGLMMEMVERGEVDALRPERLWQETDRALAEARPDIYIEVLRECGALRRLFPEIEALFGVPQPPRWHPEIDTGIHTLMALRIACALTPEADVRFAVLTHDLGKGSTPRESLPRHLGHEERSVTAIKALADRLPVPRRYRELGELVARYHGLAHRARELRPETIYKLIEAADAMRRPERFEQFLVACEADARGRLGLEDEPYMQGDYLRQALQVVRAARLGSEDAGLEGAELGEVLRRRRVSALAQALRAQPP